MGEDKLLPVQEALERLLSHFQSKNTTQVDLSAARGRILAEQVVSSLDLPPFPNSSMDGFAVRAGDISGASQAAPVSLKVVADIPAGEVVGITLQSGQAARIMTGAPLPDGADAVIPVEDTDFNYRSPGMPAPETVQVNKSIQVGDNVRPAGQDVRRGEAVLEPGRRLRPADIGFLSMLGIGQVQVYERPRVAIFSSGDELLPVEQPLSPGKIHDANSYTLSALVNEAGAEAIYLGIARDQEEDVRAILDRAVTGQIDLILSSAGVSVGAFDFVRSVVETQGSLDFWRVNMRPGKPLAFGHYQGIPFVGLPGNPVSAYVGFQVFVRPALDKMAGSRQVRRAEQQAVLLEPVQSDGRESYLRAIVENRGGRLTVRLASHQGSGNLRSLVLANSFLFVPSGVKSLATGAEVTVWLQGDLDA